MFRFVSTVIVALLIVAAWLLSHRSPEEAPASETVQSTPAPAAGSSKSFNF